MGARLLVVRLYRSELPVSESLLEPLLVLELPTADPNPPSADPSVAPSELVLPKPREVPPGWPDP